MLRKYDLIEHDYNITLDKLSKLEDDSPIRFRSRLNGIEGKFTEAYFRQVFKLIPEKIRLVSRRSYHAYDGVNNLFNLGYELLFWKCYTSIIKAHLEAYLGFLHSDVAGRPNLVYDLQEPYRYLIDDFLIDFCSGLKTRDFILKSVMWNEKRGGRLYLNEEATQAMASKIREMFSTKVKVARVRNGTSQEVESMINKEAMLLDKYLRNERPDWFPRIDPLK